MGPRSSTPHAPGRADLPVCVQWDGRASFARAVQAGHPNRRQQVLLNLESDVLAKTTAPAVLQVEDLQALAAVWEKPDFPLTTETIKCVGASFKEGGYRSASLYFQAAVQHQVRALSIEVPPLVHHCI